MEDHKIAQLKDILTVRKLMRETDLNGDEIAALEKLTTIYLDAELGPLLKKTDRLIEHEEGL